jgi:hypothetical protein
MVAKLLAILLLLFQQAKVTAMKGKTETTPCSSVTFTDDEPANHFTADCTGITTNGATCTLTLSSGYGGGSVTCDTSDGNYNVVGATSTPCNPDTFQNNLNVNFFTADCKCGGTTCNQAPQNKDRRLVATNSNYPAATSNGDTCKITNRYGGYVAGSVTCDTSDGNYTIVPAVEQRCCPEGTEQLFGVNGNCTKCPVGKYAKYGDPVCQECDLENFQYTDQTGQSSCKTCSSDTRENEGKFWNKDYTVEGQAAPRCKCHYLVLFPLCLGVVVNVFFLHPILFCFSLNFFLIQANYVRLVILDWNTWPRR